MTVPPQPIGWPLLPVPDASGKLRWPELVESIQQKIRVLLSTRPGEQLMRPRFGGGLQEFVGLPDTVATRRQIHDRVTEVLTAYEPRILLEGVDLVDDAQPGWLRIEIRFRVRRTGVPSKLGLTLALESG